MWQRSHLRVRRTVWRRRPLLEAVRRLTFGGGPGRVSPSSELSEEAPFEEVFCNIFTDEKTGNQYLKDEEGGLYDVLTRSEVGMVYEGRVILDADLDYGVECKYKGGDPTG